MFEGTAGHDIEADHASLGHALGHGVFQDLTIHHLRQLMRIENLCQLLIGMTLLAIVLGKLLDDDQCLDHREKQEAQVDDVRKIQESLILPKIDRNAGHKHQSAKNPESRAHTTVIDSSKGRDGYITEQKGVRQNKKHDRTLGHVYRSQT